MSAEDLIQAARYDELDELKLFPVSELATARDEFSGNSAMHMACANGHLDILIYLLDHVAPEDFTPLNNAGSNPLHWACLNAQLEVLRLVCPALSNEPLLQKDRGGMTPLEVAEAKGTEAAMECAGFLLGILTAREKAQKPNADDTTSLEEDLDKAQLDDDKPQIGPER